MKKQIHRICALVVVLCLMMTMLVGCGSSGKQTINDLGSSDINGDFNFGFGSKLESESTGVIDDYDYESESDGSTNEDKSDTSTEFARKIIEHVSITIETKQFDNLLQTLYDKCDELGGYIESERIRPRSSYERGDGRYANIVYRIPLDKSDEFVSFVNGSGEITDKTMSTEDVTLRYVDVESRLMALQTERDSLNALLANATDIDAIIAIHDRLTDVIYEIESANSELRTMDNLVDYTTITLCIEEVETYTPAVKELTVWEEIAEKFTGNVEQIKEDAIDVFIFVVSESPYLLMYAIVIVIIVFVLSRCSKKQKEKRDAAMAKHNAAVAGVNAAEDAIINEVTASVAADGNVENTNDK